MSNFILAVCIFLGCCTAIDAGAMTPLCDTCDCPPPEDRGHGWRLPPYADTKPKLSYDSKYLLYEPGCVLNLSDLQEIALNVNSTLPGAQILGYFNLTWSPYSSDLVALMVAMMVDTTGGTKPNVYRQHLIKYRISTTETSTITPDALLPYGAEVIGFQSWFHENGWLPGSSPQSDTFRIGMRKEPLRFGGLYVPQTQQLIPDTLPKLTIIRNSNNGKHVAWIDRIDAQLTKYYLDSIEIGFPVKPEQVTWGSFSPDGKLFALDVWPERVDTNKTYRQVWIYRTEDPSTPLHRLNFQELFCKYSFHGIWPEFITDSTLAVSMHKDGDISSPLWEITIDGRIVRQLTFLPTNSVVRDEGTQSTSYALLASDKATITVKPSSKDRQVRLINTLGQEFLSERIASGAEQIVLNVRSLPPGSYFCKLSGESELRRIVVQR
jgi:hypothetical protein